MEEKRKEVEKEADKSKKDQRKNYDEVDGSKKDHSPEDDGGDGTQETTGGATDPTDSFHHQETNMNVVQETSSQCLTAKALDKLGDVETGQADESSKELDEKVKGGFTKQVTKNHFEEQKSCEKNEGERQGKKQMPRACKMMSWWKKKWPASGDLQSRVQKEKEKNPRTEPKKDPDDADKKPDTTFVGEPDRTAKTKEKLWGHICFTQ